MSQRILLAIVGVGLVAVFLAAALANGLNGASESFFANACARIGLIVLVIALAWPHLVPLWRRLPVWFWIALFAALSIAVLRPRLILVSVGLVIAAVLIQGGLGWLSRNLRQETPSRRRPDRGSGKSADKK